MKLGLMPATPFESAKSSPEALGPAISGMSGETWMSSSGQSPKAVVT